MFITLPVKAYYITSWFLCYYITRQLFLHYPVAWFITLTVKVITLPGSYYVNRKSYYVTRELLHYPLIITLHGVTDVHRFVCPVAWYIHRSHDPSTIVNELPCCRGYLLCYTYNYVTFYFRVMYHYMLILCFIQHFCCDSVSTMTSTYNINMYVLTGLYMLLPYKHCLYYVAIAGSRITA